MRVRLKGINSKRKRLADGTFKTYYWAWKGGPPLRGEPGSPEFHASYNEAAARKAQPARGIAARAVSSWRGGIRSPLPQVGARLTMRGRFSPVYFRGA
jgi:hypothetical protein